MGSIRERLTFANVMSVAAVFIALGGTAWALGANSVGSKQIKPKAVKNSDLADNAVTSPKVANGSLLGADFAAGQLPAGAPGSDGSSCLPSNPACVGPPGPPGQNGSPDTAQQVLDKLKGVDGAGSGLDADTVDGNDSGTFATKGSEAWRGASLNTTGNCSWSNFDTTSFNSAGYFRDQAGVVHLKGLVKSTDVGAGCDTGENDRTIFALPPGYTPSKTWVFSVISNNTLGRVDVRPSGHVVMQLSFADSMRFLSLDGITFRCEPSGSNGCP